MRLSMRFALMLREKSVKKAFFAEARKKSDFCE
jgi:hypothetical protein